MIFNAPPIKTPLHENWLSGVPYPLNALLPAGVARQHLLEWTHEEVKALAEATLGAFERWKTEFGEAPRERLGLLEVEVEVKKENLEAWQCAGFAIQDPIDLLQKLQREHYPPITNLVSEHGDMALLAALVLRELAIMSEHPELAFSSLACTNHVECAQKGALLLMLKQDQDFMSQEVANQLDALLPLIIERTRQEERSAGAKKAAEAKNKDYLALKQALVMLFNQSERRYPSLRQAAKRLTPLLREHAHNHRLIWLTTDDPERRVYEWLRKAKKDGLLKNIS